MNDASGTNADQIVEHLLEQDLVEATVRRPPRGTRWIAVYTGAEPGRQVWRSTGLVDRAAALALARHWEAEARQQRLATRARKPTMRVRQGSPEAAAGMLSQAEAAAVLGISIRAVREIERRAFEKLRRHPALRRFWREYAGQAKEQQVEEAVRAVLNRHEMAALMALARTSLERRAMIKLLVLARFGPASAC